MIRSRIEEHFPHHLEQDVCCSDTLYVADYHEDTHGERGVEITDVPPTIGYFTFHNPLQIAIEGLPFGRDSFQKADGIASHCECVLYPSPAIENSWICFVELKYSETKNNPKRLPKAMSQLLQTQGYYREIDIITPANLCYFLLGLPKQPPPFLNFQLTPAELAKHRRDSLILRITDTAEVISDTKLKV